jgi:hypothetical protein
MSHYLTNEEIEARTAEVNRLQEDQDYCLSLTFHKDAAGWAADVPTHTRGENAMVAGADIAIGRMAQGDNTLEVRFRTVESATLPKPIATMTRFLHDRSGGTYLVRGLSFIPFPAWLCCVTHDVTGEHPKKIYIHEVRHYNKTIPM